MKVYSQSDEEAIIAEFFRGRVGRFANIGAYDGMHHDNFRKLYEIGWRGVCVEPAAIPFCQLQNLYANDPQMKCVNAAIADHCGLIALQESFGNMLSSTDAAHVAQWSASQEAIKFRQVWVGAITWQELLRIDPGPFLAVGVDTEGTNSKVLLSCPLERLPDTEMVIVEREPDLTPMLEFLASHGLRQHALTSENLIAVKA